MRQSITSSRSSKMHSRAFTLVELLVVISIIGILAGLTVVGISAAMRAARRTVVFTQIDAISSGLESVKTDRGSYPPNLHIIEDDVNQKKIRKADLKRYLKIAYPRNREPDDLFEQLVIVANTGNPGDDTTGVNQAEALVFWLSKMSDDPKYPISGKGGPSFLAAKTEVLEDRKFVAEFKIEQLGPRDATGIFHPTEGRTIEYTVAGVERKINLWTYTVSGKEQPYLYCDSSRGSTGTIPYTLPYYAKASVATPVYPFQTLPSAGGAGKIWASKGKFQILHAGIDEEWGKNSGITFPDGPFTKELSDNQVNFSSKTLEDSEE